MKTDVPKRIKIDLWRLIKDNPTFSAWEKAVGSFGFNTEDYDLVRGSRGSFGRLKKEITDMPYEEVEQLPADLRKWIRQLREKEPLHKNETTSIENQNKAINETQRSTISEKPLLEHWHRLNKLLREFETQLTVPQSFKLCFKSLENPIVISHSYINTLQKPAIIYENGAIKLGVENSTSPPWEYLAAHLNIEFNEFDFLLTNWKNRIANLVIECNYMTNYISDKLMVKGWETAKVDFGSGVYHDRLIKALYQCKIADEPLCFKLIPSEGSDALAELYMRYSHGMPLIARGNTIMLKAVQDCSLRILKTRKLIDSVRRIRKIVADLQDLQEQLKIMIKPVLERGTFIGHCPACSRLTSNMKP